MFVAFNPLPEDEDETILIASTMIDLWGSAYRFVIINPNTDRFAHRLEIGCHDGMYHKSLTHQEYLSYLAGADVVVGNTSSGLIEGSVYGTPYVCVGSRQQYRVHGEHVLHRKPAEIEGAIMEALEMEKRPNNSYGDKDSANKIAETLCQEIQASGNNLN